MSAPQPSSGSTPGQSSPGQLAAPFSEDGRFGSQGGQSPRQPTGDLEQPRWTPTPEAAIHAAYPFQRAYPHFAPASPDFGPHQLAAMTLARPGMALADPTGMSYIAHPYIQADFRGYVPVQAFATDPRMAPRGYEPAAFQPAMSPVPHHPRQRGGSGVGGHDQRYDGPSTDVAHNMQRDDGRGRWGGGGFQFPPQADVSRSGAPYQAEYAQGGYAGQQGPPQSKSRFHDPRLSVWVGNVPPDTSSQELYNFFGDVDVESIYVVPKSRCAFLNLYNEDQVIDVVRRYHESVFRNGRILLRPQKESPRYAAAYRQDPSLGGGSSLGPASAQFRGSSRSPSNYLPSPAGTPGSTYQQLPGQSVVPQVMVDGQSKERFFVMRSITEQAIILSVETCKWSTQLKNAAALNEAFDMCETVYLAFSVNGSRSFFGYAIMTSRIRPLKANAEDQLFATVHPKLDLTSPFTLQWVTYDCNLPFEDTNDLRNMLNMGFPVSRSKDGVELDHSCGKRLISRLDEYFAQNPSSKREVIAAVASQGAGSPVIERSRSVEDLSLAQIKVEEDLEAIRSNGATLYPSQLNPSEDPILRHRRTFSTPILESLNPASSPERSSGAMNGSLHPPSPLSMSTHAFSHTRAQSTSIYGAARGQLSPQAVLEALKRSPTTATRPAHGRSASQHMQATDAIAFAQANGALEGSPIQLSGSADSAHLAAALGHARQRSRDLAAEAFAFPPGSGLEGSNGLRSASDMPIIPSAGHSRTRSRDLAVDPFMMGNTSQVQLPGAVGHGRTRSRDFATDPFPLGSPGEGVLPTPTHTRTRSRDLISDPFPLGNPGDGPLIPAGHTRMRSRDLTEVFGLGPSPGMEGHRGSPLNSSSDGPLMMRNHARTASRDMVGGPIGFGTVRDGSIASSQSSVESLAEIMSGMPDVGDLHVRGLFASSPGLTELDKSTAGSMLGSMGSTSRLVDDVNVVRRQLMQLSMGTGSGIGSDLDGSITTSAASLMQSNAFVSEVLVAAPAEGVKHAYDEDDEMFSAGVPKLDSSPERWNAVGGQTWIGLQ